MTARRRSNAVRVGNLTVGGESPITVQSMTNTDPRDLEATLRQVRALALRGCDLVRLAVPDRGAASIFSYLKEQGITVPLVADALALPQLRVSGQVADQEYFIHGSLLSHPLLAGRSRRPPARPRQGPPCAG